MADRRLRDLERAAAAGDEDADWQLQGVRIRAGFYNRAQIELLAYAGHPLARQAIGWCCKFHFENPNTCIFERKDGTKVPYPHAPFDFDTRQILEPRLEGWLRGLQRWGSVVLLLAACSAAEAYLHDYGPRDSEMHICQSRARGLGCGLWDGRLCVFCQAALGPALAVNYAKLLLDKKAGDAFVVSGILSTQVVQVPSPFHRLLEATAGTAAGLPDLPLIVEDFVVNGIQLMWVGAEHGLRDAIRVRVIDHVLAGGRVAL